MKSAPSTGSVTITVHRVFINSLFVVFRDHNSSDTTSFFFSFNPSLCYNHRENIIALSIQITHVLIHNHHLYNNSNYCSVDKQAFQMRLQEIYQKQPSLVTERLTRHHKPWNPQAKFFTSQVHHCAISSILTCVTSPCYEWKNFLS